VQRPYHGADELSNTHRGYAKVFRMPTRKEPFVHGYSADKEQLKKRLARIEGQVRGIAKMIDDDRYCIDILTQLGAIDTALEAVAIKVLEEHVRHCVTGALASGDKKAADEKSRELLEAVQRFAKTR
jgi:CsoR family transcriptional regulator, copper-sensing transcriptional repressor